MNKMEEEKHDIALLVEYDLYETIKALDGSGNNKEERTKIIKEFIEEFIEECKERNTTMTEKELEEHIMFVLNRTIENMNILKKGDAR